MVVETRRSKLTSRLSNNYARSCSGDTLLFLTQPSCLNIIKAATRYLVSTIEHCCFMNPNAMKCWLSRKLNNTGSIVSQTLTTSAFTECGRKNGTAAESGFSVERQ